MRWLFGDVLAVAGHPAGYPGADVGVGSVDWARAAPIYTAQEAATQEATAQEAALIGWWEAAAAQVATAQEAAAEQAAAQA